MECRSFRCFKEVLGMKQDVVNNEFVFDFKKITE